MKATAACRWGRSLLVILAIVLAGLAAPARATEPRGGPTEFPGLRYRLVGPPAGGRVAGVAGVAGDPLTYYVATAAGGVWKSSDGGMRFEPIFDEQPVSSIGSIAVAPADPNVVYVGTGEANIRGNVAAGSGIFKSTDAGRSWSHVWRQVGQIGALAIHPRAAEIAYAAVLGHAFGPNSERGVYRTVDGGASWERVLFRNEETGASSLALDPSRPTVVFAGLWQARRRPWELTSGGPGSGLFRSTDSGSSWSELSGHGLPAAPWGKVGVAVAPSDGCRVYALIEAQEGGLFRSDDGGDTWKRAAGHRTLSQRPWYFSTLTVDPRNPDVVWFPQVLLLRTTDGGKTIQSVSGPHHADHHDLWIDPSNPQRIFEGNDGGVDLSWDGGKSWWAPRLPISQFYNIDVDTSVPYRVGGTMQDLGTAVGPSDDLTEGGLGLSDWTIGGGGEAGDFAFDRDDPAIVWAGEYGGYLSRYDERTGEARNVSIYPTNPSGHGAVDLRYRFQWTAPILVSSHDSKTVYHGANLLFRTTDGGASWAAVSPDLTRNDASKQHWSGGPITGDNTGVEIYGTIFSLAESPLARGLLWAGSDDGLVHLSRDGGASWENVIGRIPGLPEWGTVESIAASPFAEGTAYLVVDAHRLDDPRPYLWKTTDFGASWTSLASGLPQDSPLYVVREDPQRRDLLFVGGERGVSLSRDGGRSWQELKLNLPTVAVTDLEIKDDDLVVGTRGRSIWILDDLSPIRAWSTEIAQRSAHLFPPRPAIRWRYRDSWGDEKPGENRPHGAILDYFLKEKPKEPLVLEVFDSTGRLVRRLTSEAEPQLYPADDPDEPEEPEKAALAAEPGVNRALWDLRWAGARRLPAAKLDMGDPTEGPTVVPGSYTLRLTVDGELLETALEVRMDPRSQATVEELAAGLDFALSLRAELERLVDLIERLRLTRQRLREFATPALAGNAHGRRIAGRALDLAARLDTLERRLHNPQAEIVYDILAQPGGAQLYSILAPLYSDVREAEGAPTQGMREVAAELAAALAEGDGEFVELVESELAGLNEEAAQAGLPYVVAPPAASDAGAQRAGEAGGERN